MKKAAAAIVLFMLITSAIFASRTAPQEVEPLVWKDKIYKVNHWGFANGYNQNGGVVEVWDRKQNKLIERILVYKVQFESCLEGDVQDVFITSLSIDAQGKNLLVENEAGDTYSVNLITGEILFANE